MSNVFPRRQTTDWLRYDVVRHQVCIAMLLFFGTIPANVYAAADGQQPLAPLNAPFAMPELCRPTFANHAIDIRDHGAVGDGKTMNTKAFATAIAACAKAGGGTVLVPAGIWLTGPIHLKSNIRLHLDDKAEVLFSQRFEDYLPVVLIQRGGVRCYNYSPLIYAIDCTNVAITGGGTLNGQGQRWWPWVNKQPGMTHLFKAPAKAIPVEKRVYGTVEDGVRPPFIQTYRCKNVLLEGFTIKDGPSWTIHPVYCENVICRELRIVTHGVPNGDGIDPDSCKNMLIEHCYLKTGDDCIILKAGRNEDAWAVGIPCENIVVRHCRMDGGHCGVGVGSEMSADVRNVFVHDCEFHGVDRGIRIKSKPGRGGIVENVWVRDVTMDNVRAAAIQLTMQYATSATTDTALPKFRNMHFENITCESAKYALEIRGLPTRPIERVTIKNLVVNTQYGVFCADARDISIARLTLKTKRAAAFRVFNCQNLHIQGAIWPAASPVFLELHGSKTSEIRVTNVPRQANGQRYVLKDGASAEAVDWLQ